MCVTHNAEVALFGDDTNILITGKNNLLLNEKIQNVNNRSENWFYDNHLIINTDKSKLLFFHHSRCISSSSPVLYK
jgi:hypothetical protein